MARRVDLALDASLVDSLPGTAMRQDGNRTDDVDVAPSVGAVLRARVVSPPSPGDTIPEVLGVA